MDKKLVNVDHLAELARIQLSNDEKAILAPQMESILEYVGKLTAVDTSRIPPSAYITEAKNVFRADLVESCEPDVAARCIEAFPKKVGTALVVPGIFEERTE